MSEPSPTAQSFGAPLPPLVLPRVDDGQPVALDDVLRERLGGVVVFWSSVCSHCVRYDPYLNGFAASHPDMGLYVVATRQGETNRKSTRLNSSH